MAGDGGAWVCLFSGGKDSSWAYYEAVRSGRSVERLVTVHPRRDSVLYHVPATRLAGLAAESIGIPLAAVDLAQEPVPSSRDVGVRADRELGHLEPVLDGLDRELGGLRGIVTGVAASSFQYDRLRALCDRRGLELYAPLWDRSPRRLLEGMLGAGFEIRIVSVAAGGLDASWLGRRLGPATVGDLVRVRESHGVHLLGEGGEYETLVTNGPHMDRPLVIEGEPEWDGTRGEFLITDARLGPPHAA